jgi:hypothetical protein
MEGCILGIWIAHGEGLHFNILFSQDLTDQKPVYVHFENHLFQHDVAFHFRRKYFIQYL